ncbi:hypothetical protein [Planktothrix paucivesiculata]|uniref:Uncharacterized protein n=1 Tax=Planktothrix paucivesiculata PCC 9631 TaxID=671071 RepID=A0A7Z9C0V0_9CYAN|nr:hypothetical protein [Planktothrix paucivesiculata]VXD23526.1 hypothetical protein PL9631_740018 [Planktothrix paucivesiculata PCC 9631]
MKMTRSSSLATLHTSFPVLPSYQDKGLSLGQNIIHSLKSITAIFMNAFASPTEPKIWQKKDADGNMIWQIYDPVTGYKARFDTEQEIRIWLEKRYNL